VNKSGHKKEVTLQAEELPPAGNCGKALYLKDIK
jgi:hypothetical protein